MTLLQHLNKVSKERGFDSFIKATLETKPEIIRLIIEEAGNRFKNEE